MKTKIAFSVTFAILESIIVYVQHQVEGLSNLSSPICILLGKSENSMSQNIVTVVVSLYLLLSLFIILILYSKLIILRSDSDKVLILYMVG